tara:strand:+ start:327 stop:2504 length:2178 start_codon:yes stop_codon:yes gene_type:complete
MRKDKYMRDNTKYSSYWLKDDLFDGNTSDDVIENKQSNLLALSSYKRAISNFVNIVTNENIKVTFDERGADSYTDGKSVVISAKMDDKEFDPTVGLALHEGSHIKLTNFDTLGTINNYIGNVVGYELITELMEKHSKDEFQTKNYIKDIVKNLLNVIEDRRIDYYVYSTSPGYKGYYHAMYDKYFHANIIDKGLQSSEYRELDWESYMFRIINITNEHRDLDALPELRAVWDMLDLKNIQRLTNTEESMKLAASIFKLIENSLPADQKPIESPNEQEGEGGGTEGEQSEGSGAGGGGDNSDTNGTDNTEGSGGEPKDGSNDTDDTNGDADGDDTQSGSTSYNPNGAGGDGSNNQIADNKVESSEGEGRMSDRQKKQLDNAIKKQKDFQNGDIKKKKVSKNENKKIETLAKSGIEEKLVGEGYKSADYWRKDKKIPVMIIRNFTKQLAESNTINMLSTWEYRCADNQVPVNKGIQIGTMLGRKLKLRSEERSLTTPRMKNGKISGRLLHELGMGNTNVFDQIVVDKHSPALVHISIDASSSMGGKKWSNSQTAAVAIAKAASMTPNLNVVISYRSIQHNGGTNGNVQPLMLIAYDSRTDKFSKIQQLFQYLNPCGTTPEGLCFESILDEITKTSKGIDSYFINFSDGYPGFSNSDMDYYGGGAIAHTSTQVKKMQMAGVKVLSYFIEEGGYGNAMGSFKEMYGKSAENVNVTSVIPLTKTLNKLFQ